MVSRQEDSEGCSLIGHSDVVGYLNSSAAVGLVSPVGRTGWEGRKGAALSESSKGARVL